MQVISSSQKAPIVELEVFIPPDRRRALARGELLPDRAHGAVLFADVSGFTSLTDALVKELGPRQGIDELTQQLNRVYDALIAEVDRYGGSVIFFSGDAITCWFDSDDGEQALTCALQMQQAMLPFATVATPSGLIVSLAIKVVVTTGPVRRFLVGDPQIQLLDVLAGQTLDRMAHIEHHAQKGEILAGAEVAAHLGDKLQVAEWRYEVEAKPEERSAVIASLTLRPSTFPPFHPSTPPPLLPETQARSWLLPPVYERLKAGGGRFLAELRTAVALFISFHGLDYDHDDEAGDKLDAYIRWVQNILARYEGNLLQLTIGDKGSYLYATFGAPLAHGDDASRAVAAALELQNLPPTLGFITYTQTGLSQGRMRAGAYGSHSRRTYGVLGSEANIAARLMSRAKPNQILVSKHVAETATKNFQFTYLETTAIKGRTDPIPVFEISNRRSALHPRPVVSIERERIREQLAEVLKAVQSDQGRILRLDNAPGISQTHLATDLVEQAAAQGFQIARGVCQAPGQDAIYSPWREMLRDWFELSSAPQEKEDRTAWLNHQNSQVKILIAETNPDWLPFLPLLGDLLGLPIPDNETTALFDPLVRRGMLLALALEMIKTWVAAQPSLILIEEAHRLDEAARRLTLALARSITTAPVLLALVHRLPQPSDEQLLPELNQLPHYHQLHLSAPAGPQRVDQRPNHKPAGTPVPSAASMIGRRAERMLLAGQLHALLHGGIGGTILIEGEAGIGKSRLIADLLEQAKNPGITWLIGGGDAIEQSTPYHAWRPLFRQLFSLDTRPATTTMARRSHVLSLLPTTPELLRLAPLLNAVLPLGLQESDLTRQMTGQVRADNTRDLLLNLLQGAMTQSPSLIIMEDAHWLDSASWALIRLVSQRIQHALLIIVARPLTDPLPIEYSQLLQGPNVQRIKLEALSPDETLTLVCQRLGVKVLPETVWSLIRAKAEGHPFFSEELAYALRDAGLIRIVAGECQLVSAVDTFEALSLPNTVEEVITSRIDRLSAPQQLTLKVASVIGRTFSVKLLGDIHPNEADKSLLPIHLTSLTELDITRLDTPPPSLAYIFKHAITREVAYNLMLFDQRRGLHQAVAEWFERIYANDLLPFYPLLAHHWSQVIGGRAGGSPAVAKAINYLEKAGEQALSSYANQEAVRFLSQAIALTNLYYNRHEPFNGNPAAGLKNTPPNAPTHLRLLRWERQLGEAYLGLGQLAESRDHLERVVAGLGWPQPGRRVRRATGLAGQILEQISHRLWPVKLGPANPQRQAILLEAARTYERLGEIYYWSNETLPAIYAALRTLNLTERAGPSPELARAYANMCLVAGFASLHSLADSYSRRAQAAAHEARHEPALAWVLELTGIYAISIGQWAKAGATLRHGAQVAQRLEDRRRWEECITAVSDISFFQGQWAESSTLWQELYNSARRRGDTQAQSWGLAGRLRSLIALGELYTEEVLAIFQMLERLLLEDIGSADKINSYGIIGLLHWRRGESKLAQKAAEAAITWIAQSSPTGFGIIHGYNNVAEVCLALWEEEGTGVGGRRSDQSSHISHPKSNAGQTCQALHQYARAFPIGRPCAWLWQGLYDWLSGQPRQAHSAWRKSVTEAERLAMPYEQALALYEMGRHLPVHDPNRSAYLTHAIEIFGRLQASYDLNRTQQALAVGRDLRNEK